MNMTQATHLNVSTMACKTCHEAGLSFFMGAASPGLQGRPANHTSAGMAAPNDCAGCHTTANWNSGALPAGHMPNPGNQTCIHCHTASPASYVAMAANAVLHTGISGNCLQCHGVTQLAFYNNNDPPKPQVANHIPYLAGSDCGSCHKTATYAAGAFGPIRRGMPQAHAADRAVSSRWAPAATASDQLLAHLVDQETGERGYVITGDPAFLQPYEEGRAKTAQDLTQIQALVGDIPAVATALMASS